MPGPELSGIAEPMRQDRRPRLCLRCRLTFDSEWSGERVCSRCKLSSAWRAGQPIQPRPSRKA